MSAMKILLAELEGATPEGILEDERLANLRNLMEIGSYGRLGGEDASDPNLGDVILAAGGKSLIFQDPRDCFDRLRQSMTGQPWDCIQLRMDADACRNLTTLDEELGLLLVLIAEETAVLLVSFPGPGRDGFFILAAPRLPPLGLVEGATWADLVATVLELGGYARPAGLPGRSLATGRLQDTTELDEDEAIVRERLSGLGYIG
jgi:hypothetical protein